MFSTGYDDTLLDSPLLYVSFPLESELLGPYCKLKKCHLCFVCLYLDTDE